MKKIFAVLSIALWLTACGSTKHELNDLERRVYSYQEQILEAMEAEERERVDALYDDMHEWLEGLEPEVRQEAEFIIDEWRRENAERIDGAM